MRLTELCSVHTGYTARSRLEPSQQGGVPAIQLRDIPVDGDIDPSRLTRVDLVGLPDRYFVRTGDVVFRSRGEWNTAWVLDGRFTEPVLAVLPLIILRPKPGMVIAEYLAWAINQPDAQRHFDSTARGTSMRMVPKSSLDDLHLDVPDIETQRKIIVIDALAECEKALMLRLAEKRRKLTSRVLGEHARSAHHGTSQHRSEG